MNNKKNKALNNCYLQKSQTLKNIDEIQITFRIIDTNRNIITINN